MSNEKYQEQLSVVEDCIIELVRLESISEMNDFRDPFDEDKRDSFEIIDNIARLVLSFRNLHNELTKKSKIKS